MDRVLQLKTAFRESGFEYRSCRYYGSQPNTILVCLRSPLQRPEFLQIVQQLGYTRVEQPGLSSYVLEY